MRRVAVLISGRGSNLQALVDAGPGALDAQIVLVVSNVPAAAGLQRAERAGIPTRILDHRGLARDEHDARVADLLAATGIDLVCLAGYMRILGPRLVAAYDGRVLNVHPSLLPAFPGRDAPAQALRHGVKVSGATVHLVDAGMDSGPIVCQEPVPVLEGDSAESLAARILEVEHRIYPTAVRLLARPHWIDGRRLLFEKPPQAP